jgi:hypothetical protein
MRNKKGQFFIIAAIIIVLIIAGIASIKTYAIVSPEPRAIQDLGSELQEETSRIVDYGIYNKNTENLNEILDNFTDTEFAPYFLQKTSETGIVFVYGNQTSLEAVEYDYASTGVLSATIGTGVTNWAPVTTFAKRVSVSTLEDPIKVTILNKTFNFDLQNNEMFYFVIIQEKDGETYIEKN